MADRSSISPPKTTAPAMAAQRAATLQPSAPNCQAQHTGQDGRPKPAAEVLQPHGKHVGGRHWRLAPGRVEVASLTVRPSPHPHEKSPQHFCAMALLILSASGCAARSDGSRARLAVDEVCVLIVVSCEQPPALIVRSSACNTGGSRTLWQLPPALVPPQVPLCGDCPVVAPAPPASLSLPNDPSRPPRPSRRRQESQQDHRRKTMRE